MLAALIAPLLLAPGQGLLDDDVRLEPHERDAARALFEASRADLKDLVKRWRKAVDDLSRLARANFTAGRISAAMARDVHLEKTKATLPPTTNDWPEDLLLEEWEYRWEIYRMEKSMFEAVKGSRALYLVAAISLLEAEIQMALRREKPPKK